MSKSISLVRALYHVKSALTYFEDVVNERPRVKRLVGQYINKCNFILNDAMSNLDTESRKDFVAEFKVGDSLQYEHIFQLLYQMSPEQRDIVEKVCEATLQGKLEYTES